MLHEQYCQPHWGNHQKWNDCPLNRFKTHANTLLQEHEYQGGGLLYQQASPWYFLRYILQILSKAIFKKSSWERGYAIFHKYDQTSRQKRRAVIRPEYPCHCSQQRKKECNKDKRTGHQPKLPYWKSRVKQYHCEKGRQQIRNACHTYSGKDTQ